METQQDISNQDTEKVALTDTVTIEQQTLQLPNAVSEYLRNNESTPGVQDTKVSPAIENLMNVINSSLESLSLQAADVWISIPAPNETNIPEMWSKYLFGITKDTALSMWNEVSSGPLMSKPLSKTLPGRLLSSQEPCWMADNNTQEMSQELFPRISVARSIGIKTIIGVPILKKSNNPTGPYHGVLMFYSTSLLDYSPQTISFISEATQSIFYPDDVPSPMNDTHSFPSSSPAATPTSTSTPPLIPANPVPILTSVTNAVQTVDPTQQGIMMNQGIPQSMMMYPMYQQPPNGVFPANAVTPAMQQHFQFLVQMREQQRLGQVGMPWGAPAYPPAGLTEPTQATALPTDTENPSNTLSNNPIDQSTSQSSIPVRCKGPLCSRPGCTRAAQGITEFCISHGGGRRCKHPGCIRGARDRFFCTAHGGGRRCATEGCDKSAVGASKQCTAHGGGRRCQIEGCPKSAQSSTKFCVKHGGGRKCATDGCEKVARGRTQHCAGHGGGVRCGASGCRKAAIGLTLLCRAHKMERESDPAAALYQLRQILPDPSPGTSDNGVAVPSSAPPATMPFSIEGQTLQQQQQQQQQHQQAIQQQQQLQHHHQQQQHQQQQQQQHQQEEQPTQQQPTTQQQEEEPTTQQVSSLAHKVSETSEPLIQSLDTLHQNQIYGEPNQQTHLTENNREPPIETQEYAKRPRVENIDI